MTDRPVALVTGASAGIGAALARALAGRGYDLVVVARDTARLQALAADLDARHGRTTEVLPADLVTGLGRDVVEARLSDRTAPVDLLVNNAGFGSHGRFAELERAVEAELVELNVVALVRLTHAAVGPMVERGRGGVINVSSVAGVQPTPYAATYGASKAFVTSFTHAVHEEVRGSGVRLMVLAPGYTHSEFHQRIDARSGAVGGRRGGWLWQTSAAVADAAVRAYERGDTVCVPGAVNRVVAAVSGLLPDRLTRRIASRMTRSGF